MSFERWASWATVIVEMVRCVEESGSVVNAYIVEGVSSTVMTIHEHSLAHRCLLQSFHARWRRVWRCKVDDGFW